MNKNLLFVTLFLLFFYLGCSKDDPVSPGTGGGIGGTNSVSFTISTQPGTQGGTVLFAAPSVDVVITQVDVSVPAENFTDTVQGDGTTVFPANQPVSIDEYTGVQSGQQWVFRFQGKIGSSTGQAFDVSTNYTIP
jgi:hypothetical protein